MGLAAKAREPDPGRDHLALALLELHRDKPDMAAARAHLDRAEDAGVDVARHHSLLAPRDEEPREPVPARPRQPTKYVTFTGKPLRIDAQDAHARLGAMQVRRDRTAVGGAFVWAPQGRGRDKWADDFHVAGGADQHGDALADQGVIVRQENANLLLFRHGFTPHVLGARQGYRPARSWFVADLLS